MVFQYAVGIPPRPTGGNPLWGLQPLSPWLQVLELGNFTREQGSAQLLRIFPLACVE